ncbi:MAG TPA: hypothetical protein VLU91_05750 [Nitrososphaerales archaeon]|nr:hypothetical protein [Nitrososphaerales archaeon]
MKWALIGALWIALLVALSGSAAALSYSLTVQTNATSYVGESTVLITGQVTPAPGPNSSVSLRVYNPNMLLATAAVAPVNGTTGLYSSTFVTGGSSAWIEGTYSVNATWGAYGPVIFKITTFSWASSATSTSTSATSTTTVSTFSSATSTTSSTSNPTTSITSTTTTSSLVTSSSTTSTSVSSASSSATSSGTVPEFPFQIVVVVLFSALIAGSFLVMRSRRAHAPSGFPR